jgi:endoglucanase
VAKEISPEQEETCRFVHGNRKMHRRKFIHSLGAGVLGLAAANSAVAGLRATDDIDARHIPRWRGFNLQGWFGTPDKPNRGAAYEEFDFATMAEWGFNFARLPLSYWTWGRKDDWSFINEEPLKQIDQAVELGRQYSIHINLNFHRIPGYCINERELEPADLFSGTTSQREKALAAAIFHWQVFTKRYKGIPNSRLSFDLINEPPKMRSYEGYLEERYVEIVKALVKAIREIDPERLIFADGINIGQLPVMGIADLGLVQSTRGYLPKAVTHYTATWVPKDEFESFNIPTWPLKDDKGTVWDKARLQRESIDPYKALVSKGVQVHVGEWGCYNQTPHDVALAWMSDYLSLWKTAGWGFSMWNLRGSFGILDSGRKDVPYEDFKGHKLDRRMLELLRKN